MIRTFPRSATTISLPRLDLLRIWLTVGIAAVVLIPAARGHSLWFGWLPYWLIAAPALMLALRHRLRLTAALTAYLVASQRRRRRSLPQARPLAKLRTIARSTRTMRPARRPLRRALVAALRFGL